MSTLTDFLTFEYANAYDLSQKKQYSIPKIYDSKGDLTKRWYVYYSFRNPSTGKLKRMSPIYAGASKYDNKKDRMAVLNGHRKILLKLLKLGYNPFKDNTELHEKLRNKQKPLPTTNPIPTPQIIEEKEVGMEFSKALEFVINQKIKQYSESGKSSFLSRIRDFESWIKETHPTIISIIEINRRIVMTYLNHILDRTSPTTRNNYKADLSSVFQMLEDNEIISKNIFKGIPSLKTKPKRNKTYTIEQQEEIFDYLVHVDPILLLYIKFISFNLLRPIEVCRLKLKDIDFKGRKLQFKAKNSPLKTKIIPEILFEEIKGLSELNGDLFLFTPEAIGGEWEAELRNRRDHFSKRFKKVVKKHFELSIDYTMYSFRHTFITKLYRELAKDLTPFEVKSKLMLITGHSTMEALEKYLRDIDAQLPADYSHLLR